MTDTKSDFWRFVPKSFALLVVEKSVPDEVYHLNDSELTISECRPAVVRFGRAR